MTSDTAPDPGHAREWRDQLRVAGRVTPARLLVLEALDAGRGSRVASTSRSRRSTARVSRSRRSVNLSTVYRAIRRLQVLGLVHRLDAPGGAKYGLYQHPHHHAICVSCERVIEVTPTDVSRALVLLADDTGIAPDHTSSLTFRITCHACLQDPPDDREEA